MDPCRISFTLLDNTQPQRRHTVRADEDVAVLERNIEKKPNESIHHRAHELQILMEYFAEKS